MTDKNQPTDLSGVFKMFENAFANPFAEPDVFAKWFGGTGVADIDPQKLLKENKDRIEALERANREAFNAYQSQVKRQAEIFDAIMKSAQESLANTEVKGTADAANRNFKTYSDAFEQATGLMQRLSEETRAATEEAYRKISAELETIAKSFHAK